MLRSRKGLDKLSLMPYFRFPELGGCHPSGLHNETDAKRVYKGAELILYFNIRQVGSAFTATRATAVFRLQVLINHPPDIKCC